MKASTTNKLQWMPLGPALNGARVEAVQADPSHPGTLYAAFGSGGLWKTVNNGINWSPIFENMPSLGIGDIALAPSDPNIIYVGTGESLKKARNFTMPGTGIYRSSDAGISWQHLGLNDTWHISEISVHPQNPDIVLVAALGHFWSPNKARGIFRTADGGKSWTQVLYIDENTGANDIVISPVDPNIVYATVWQHAPEVHGKNSGIYKSEDGGITWEKASDGIHIDENTGRVGIATSYQDKNKAYVFVDQRNRGDDKGAGEIYVTTDGGNSWSMTHKEDILSLSVIGWYFMDIYVNPQDDDEIYGLGVRLLHSTNGGKTFEYLGGQVSHLNPNPAQTLHLDHCELWINPHNPNELLLGNDGGVYHSYDNGSAWHHLNNIPTGEFYDIAIDSEQPYTIYGGTQDDATVYGNAKEFNAEFNDSWQYLWIDAWSGGDGCITLVDPNDPNIVYFSMQNGGARRMNLDSGKSVSIRPRFPNSDSIDLQYTFITPYMLSSYNSKRLYMGSNYVLQSDNQGASWKIISPDLIKTRSHPESETAVSAIAESMHNEGTIYAGTDRGSLWLTGNSGADWRLVSKGLPANYIRQIVPSKHKKGRVYLQMTGLNYDDLAAYLYKSDDYGKNWQSIVSNLPNQPINAILEDPENENILFAGTYRGVYFSMNQGSTWEYLGAEMPDASIADMVIEPRSKDLVVATHGRGIYKLNLKPMYAHLAQSTPYASPYVFTIPPAYYPDVRDTHRDIDRESAKKLPISFWLTEQQSIKLKVTDTADSVFWSMTINGESGLNQYPWDMIIKENTSNSPYFIHYQRFLPRGKYKLILEGINGVDRKPFEVY